MSNIVSIWVVITLLLGVVASFAIWARGFSRARGFAVLAFLLSSPVAAAALAFSLGWPVPLVEGATLPAGHHLILGSKIVIDDGIYLLLDQGDASPRYFKLPWSAKTADKLQQALDEKGEGGQAGLDSGSFKWPWQKDGEGGGQQAPAQKGEAAPSIEPNPFEWSWDMHEPQFWAKPQPKVLPDKPTPPPAPTYDQNI